ncbi:laminin subunit gamma-3, partial [Lates japonicus]
GFYGDALNQTASQKCKPCSCNPAGTSGHVNECHPQTGNCQCLSHVTGRDCSYCEVGFFNLQPGVGCERCKCNPIGSSSIACHPITGQCVCRAGVEGRLCDFAVWASLDSHHKVAEPVTVTRWAPCPCSVTVMVPATVVRASWVTNVTN